MTYLFLAALLAVTLWILASTRLIDKASRAPALLLVVGASLSLIYRGLGAPTLSSEWVAFGADLLLAALAFGAATQFRLTKLARICPASFRLTVGGAPLYLVICGLCAFILTSQLDLAGAFLLAGALMLNGAAFDRRAVTDAPTPAIIKAAVRLESAAILALGIPVAVLLESVATTATQGEPVVAPIFSAAQAMFTGFAIGGSSGLISAKFSNRSKNKRYVAASAVMAGFVALALTLLLGGNPIIAAAAAGLLWGEETNALTATRLRLRHSAERLVAPIAYFAFGVLLAPRVLQADLLSALFAISAVTIMRAGPRLVSLQQTSLPKESQMFLAWFGGAPGAASALFLISLFDATTIPTLDAVLSIGALAVTFGVFGARLTSRPLLRLFLKETALARRKAMLPGAS